MRISHFFIDHPIFAAVLSMFITIVGGVAYFTLPVSQYPSIAPPIVQVTASYPGASAEVLSQTVATPIEQQINGVENMLYLSSQATGNGKLVISVTFKLGTDLDTAQVLTAEPCRRGPAAPAGRGPAAWRDGDQELAGPDDGDPSALPCPHA